MDVFDPFKSKPDKTEVLKLFIEQLDKVDDWSNFNVDEKKETISYGFSWYGDGESFYFTLQIKKPKTGMPSVSVDKNEEKPF